MYGFRLSESDLAFKKIVYREYEVDFKQEKPRDELSGKGNIFRLYSMYSVPMIMNPNELQL